MGLRAYSARMKRLDTQGLSRRLARQLGAPLPPGCIPSLQDAQLTGVCAPLPMQEEPLPRMRT